VTGRAAVAILLLVAVATALQANMLVAERGVTIFPGGESTAPSPTGRLVIRNVDSDAEPHHTLYLKQANGSEHRLLSYGRHVSVLWAPNERTVVVNDFAGSDYSVCRVYLVESGRAVDVSQAIRTRYGDDTVFENHHVYFEAVAWRGAETLKVKVWGYGDQHPNGFTRFFTYGLDGEVRGLPR